MLVAATVTTWADTFPYITLERADGTGVSLTAVGLEFTFSGGKVIATNSATGQSQTLSLADLAKMYFAVADISTSVDETPSNVHVSLLNRCVFVSGAEGAEVIIANMAGVVVAEAVIDSNATTPVGEPLARGIYIIKVNDKTKKVIVR